jgi:broad specificity phosphatase PhoE
MRLILVRHGQSPSNIDHLIDTTVPGPRLTELGIAQAEALPAALAGEAIDVIYASSMTRAQMTAEPLARERGLPVNVRDGLREITAGELEMTSDDESIQRYLSTAFAWSAGDLDLRMPGGESGTEAFARYDAVVAEAAAATIGTALLVSHGGVIRMWVAGRADNVDAGFAGANPLPNTAMIIVDGDPATGWHVDSWTDRMVAGACVDDRDEGDDGDGPGGKPFDPIDVLDATER